MRIILDEDDYATIETDIFENMEEYLQIEMLNISSPQFYEDLVEDITNVFHDYWMDCGFCEEEDYDEVKNIIENLLDVYLDFSIVPRRSVCYESYIENNNKNTDEIIKQIALLKAAPQPKQKTTEWHEFRYNLITASNIWKALSSEAQRNSLIYEKCKPLNLSYSNISMSNTESAFHWGIKYEPVTVMIYEYMYQTKVDDFGCIQHSEYNFIGASPDGINVDPSNKERYGRMLEIKNIFNREITGIPKEEYWVQTQIQMETCGLDECDFMETRFKQFDTSKDFYQDEQHEYKGVILQFMIRTSNMSTESIANNLSSLNAPIYKYMPIDILINKDSIENWINQEKNNSPEWILFSIHYWYLDEFSCVLIQRNRAWFLTALPIIRETWNTILKERIEGYQHRSSKKRSIKVEKSGECTSQTIKNMPLTNSICLVKLDHNDLLE